MRDFATAVRAAQSSDEGAIEAAFPDPEPLIGLKDDEWDREPIW